MVLGAGTGGTITGVARKLKDVLGDQCKACAEVTEVWYGFIVKVWSLELIQWGRFWQCRTR